MKNLMLFIYVLSLCGCALSGSQDKSKTAAQLQHSKRSGFVPAELVINRDGQNLVLIDVVEFPKGAYELDQVLQAKGEVSYPYQAPEYTPTRCQGVGYTVEYVASNKVTTNNVKTVFYINGTKSSLDHLTLSTADTLQMAVYAEHQGITDYYDKGELPHEFSKKLLPSNNCKYMCRQAFIPVLRPLKAGKHGNCYLYNLPGYFWFDPNQLDEDDLRYNFGITEYESCDAVRSNADLHYYYSFAEKDDCTNSGTHFDKTVMDEWYYVEQKIPYQAPIYTIQNISELIKGDLEITKSLATNRPVSPFQDWQ